MDARKAIAEFLKVDLANVTVHVTLLGGGFGRKSKPDFICERRLFLARAVGAVRVQWTREDDLQHSYYHSVAAHRLAALDSSGKVTAWLHRSAYPAIASVFAPNVPGPSADELTNGASDIPFDIPNMSVEACPAVAMARIGWYRSVNAVHYGFAIGSFVDELAHAAKQDTGDFLLQLIGSDRQVDLSKAGLVAPASNYGATWADHPLDSARARGRAAGDGQERDGRGGKLRAARGVASPSIAASCRTWRWWWRSRCSPTGPCWCRRRPSRSTPGMSPTPIVPGHRWRALITAMSNTL
ncbi:MAG: molybdopterin-dependent oxidoreductase [Gemmatimonadetes bacterium]|nr:molybdopterin-dependent oxidoreductase [Gemmatimonadota bacterium]